MKIRLLLVDDEVEFSETLAERLRTRNLPVVSAPGCEEALECMRREEFDVVVVDMLMPGKDGLETLREIKQFKPLVEVILLTGHANVDAAVEGMKTGAYYYLIKPVEIKTLMEHIAGAYHRKVEHEERIKKAEIQRILKS